MAAVVVEFGATVLLADVTFSVERGERWGVVGRNGSGKTTIFRLLAGESAPTRGTIARTGGIRISVLEQHRDFGAATTVWEAAAGPFAELLALEHSLAEQAHALGAAGDASTPEMLARYSRDLERFSRRGRLHDRAPRRRRAARSRLRSRGARTRPLAHAERRRARPRRAGPPARGAGRCAPPRRAHQPSRSRDHDAGSRTICRRSTRRCS